MNVRRHMYLERKRADYMSAVRHKCRCGHVVYIPARCKFVYCDWCYRRVWRDEQTKFKYKLMEKMGVVYDYITFEDITGKKIRINKKNLSSIILEEIVEKVEDK